MMQIGIVRARFNEQYTAEMLEAAKEHAAEKDIEVAEVIEVPGSHEAPLAAKRLLEQDEIDGVVVVGAIITGATDHDQVLGYNVSKQLLELSCNHKKPVGLGIIGPGVSWAQVETRTVDYAQQAVEAVKDTYEALSGLE